MDPPSLMSKGPLQEMWMFPQPAASPGGGVLWMHPAAPRVVPLGRDSGFAEVIGARATSVEESTVTGQSGGARGRWNRGGSGNPGTAGSEDESSKLVSTCSGNELIESETQHLRAGGSRDGHGECNADVEANSGICNKLTDEGAQHSEAPKQDYIHVRARRGQATDSHSLAERARREKISERMKILQDLVPGCNKVIGKALVLDEIINYIQSLQRQVEFLSMKLEALSSQMNPSIKGFPAKDFGVQAYDSASGLAFTLQTREYRQGSSQELLHMQERNSPTRRARSPRPPLPRPTSTVLAASG